MDGIALIGIAAGIPTTLAFGGLAGVFIRIGRLNQKVETICEWQPECDKKLDDTAERVARIEGYLNGKVFPRKE